MEWSMSRMMRRLIGLMILVVAGLGVLMTSGSVYAEDTFYQKAAYEGVIKCYESGLEESISIASFDGTVNKLAPTSAVPTPGKTTDIIRCSKLLTEKVAKPLANNVTENTDERRKRLTEGAMYTRVNGTGETGSDAKCASFKYVSGETPSLHDTPVVCIENGADGMLFSVEGENSGFVTFEGAGTSTLTIKASGYGGLFGVQYVDISERVSLSGTSSVEEALVAVGNSLGTLLEVDYDHAKGIEYVSTGYSQGVTIRYYAACVSYAWDSASANVLSCGSTHVPEINGVGGTARFNATITAQSTLDEEYEKPNVTSAEKKAEILKHYSDSVYRGYNGLEFTPEETYRLYIEYLKRYFNMSDFECSETPLSLDRGWNYSDIRMWENTRGKWMEHCYFKATSPMVSTGTINSNYQTETVPLSVWGVGSDKHFGVPVTLEEIVEWIKGANITGDPFEGNSNGGGGGGGGGGASDPGGNNDIGTPGNLPTLNDNYCYGNGLGSTEWIMCPAIDNMRYTVSGLDQVIQSWLEVPERNYDSTSAVPTVWDVMRNAANTMMIIVLVVIIFSQLTGYGIDNYGIKKMLPKLILMTVVINMSLIICQLAVDLSNILGVGLRNLFGSVGEAISNPGLRGDAFIGGAMAMILTGAGVAGAASGTVLTIVTLGGGGAMALIIILLALAAILVAVLIFFVMLGARQVIVMLCVALAPIAFAMYILPNTQSLFKRWWKLFEAALVMFPICGALGGISMLVRGLLSNIDGESQVWEWVVAMLLPFLPFFLLPSLLRGALAALGQVGGAITAGLTALRTGANKAIDAGRSAVQGSEAYKNAQAEAARRRQERNAQRTVGRLRGRFSELKARSANGDERAKRDLRRLRDAQQKLRDLSMDDASANTSPEVMDVRTDAAIEAQELKNYNDQYSNLTRDKVAEELVKAIEAYNNNRSEENKRRLKAVLITAEGRGMNKEMLSGLGNLNLSANNARDAQILGQLSGSSNKVISQYGKQMSKPDNIAKNMSLDGFTAGTDMTGTGTTLREALAAQGGNALNGMDDDTLEYIKNSNTTGRQVTPEMLLNAASHASNDKELKQINEMLQQINPSQIRLSGGQLGKINTTTMQTLAGMAKTNSDLQQSIMSAYSDLQKSPTAFQNLDRGVRDILDGMQVQNGPVQQNSGPTNGMDIPHGMVS